VLGSRCSDTGKKLWDKIKNIVNGNVATDYYKAYQSFIPTNLHIQSKAQTYTVEGLNSVLRHYLARLHRKTKCYSKSYQMLEYSIRLLFAKHNNMLSILN
jgi:IS1 family transposase